MKKYLLVLMGILAYSWGIVSYAGQLTTQRFPQFANEKVNAWTTIIYPSKQQALKMHRHDHDRTLIAFTDGVLKITNDKGQQHLLTLKKEHAYYLQRDVPGELHSDENISHRPIKVMVIEFQQ